MNDTHFDTVIIGGGISGISAADYLQADCPTKTYIILEGRKNIGGKYDLFHYPGIRSDSALYTFGLALQAWTNDISRSPKEFTKSKDMANGANVILQTILSVDKT